MRRLLLVIAAAVGAIYFFGERSDEVTLTEVSRSAPSETYRVVHAIGNSERYIATELSERECRRRREEHKVIVKSLGTGGSVTCLPESIFRD